MRQEVYEYINRQYKVSPEYPWAKDQTSAVFRHGDNRKWFALIMDVKRNKLGLAGEDSVDAVNLKIDDMFFRDMLVREEGIMPAYHMNKEHWITVLLDGTVETEKVYDLIDRSFLATASKKRKTEFKEERNGNSDFINWKQFQSGCAEVSARSGKERGRGA